MKARSDVYVYPERAAGAGSISIGTAYASGALTPSAVSSLSNLMCGLAGAFMPSRSGTVLITLNAFIISSSGTLADGAQWQLRYGTGAAPVAGGAVKGFLVGAPVKWLNPVALTAADIAVPLSLSAVATGLVPGTAYWLDLMQKAFGTLSAFNLSGPAFAVIEL